MTSPTAYPEDNSRYDGAIEELAGELVTGFPWDAEVIREMLIDAVDAGDEAAIATFANMLQAGFKRLVADGCLIDPGDVPLNRAASAVATRRIDARLKSDPDFRAFIDSGKWPRGGDV